MKNDPYIVAAFIKAKQQEHWPSDGTSPIVTISRQCGAGGGEIALRTAEILTHLSHGKQPWMVVDKDIAQRIIEDHHLPKQIARYLTEEQTMSIEEHVEGILGISVSGPALLQKMTTTMVHLARMGHVILVGRAANVITAKFPRAVHVRIIGSFDRRVERIMELEKCSWEEAATKVKTVDENRRRFVATCFHAKIDDVSGYDMAFNTDRVSVEEAARMIAHLVSSPDFRSKEAGKLSELRHLVLG